MLLVGEENFAHRSHNRHYVIGFRMTVAAGTRQLFLMARIAVVMARRKKIGGDLAGGGGCMAVDTLHAGTLDMKLVRELYLRGLIPIHFRSHRGTSCIQRRKVQRGPQAKGNDKKDGEKCMSSYHG
jgi:hypothetical protein